jgi:hypothetical protein
VVKIKSPVGEYEYRVERVTFHAGRLEVLGSLGQWQTTTIIEPADFWNLLRKSAFPALVIGGAWIVTRRFRRV